MMFPQIQQYLSRTMAIIIQFILVILLLRFFLIDSGQVNGLSMEPNYSDKEFFLVNRIVFLIRPPQRYEVVQLFDESTDQFFIKRIIGLPGETVIIKHDGVYVQTISHEILQLNELYLSLDTRTSVQPGQPLKTYVPSNFYFVLGDNRPHSNDSRDFGSIHRRYIEGKLIQL